MHAHVATCCLLDNIRRLTSYDQLNQSSLFYSALVGETLANLWPFAKVSLYVVYVYMLIYIIFELRSSYIPIDHHGPVT